MCVITCLISHPVSMSYNMSQGKGASMFGLVHLVQYNTTLRLSDNAIMHTEYGKEQRKSTRQKRRRDTGTKQFN